MSFDELLHLSTLVVIGLSSLLALGVGIERLIALWGLSSKTRELGQVIARHLLRGDVAAGRSAADRATIPAAELFRAGFDRAQKTVGPPLDAAVDRERLQLALRLKRGLWILGTIGAITPFVGLFGTVLGIMKSFKDLGVDVEQGGGGGSAAVMVGISNALLATAAGIVVAVEAVILYNVFQARLGRLNVELKLIAEEFVELLREAPRQATPSPDVPAAQPAAPQGT